MICIVINYYINPDEAIGAVRNIAILEQYSLFFEKVILITKEQKFEIRGLPNNVLHIPIPAKDLKNLNKSRKNGSDNRKTNVGSRLIGRVLNSVPISFLLKEGGLYYINSALRAAENHLNGPAVVASSFLPLADHVISFLLSRKRTDLFWIADFRDIPFNVERKNVFWPRWHSVFYRTLLKRANLIMSVSSGVSDFYARYGTNLQVLRNGISKIPQHDLPESTDRFQIAYTGRLYGGRRDPSRLFQVLAKIEQSDPEIFERLEIIYAGSDGDQWDEYCEKHGLLAKCTNMGLISRDRCLAIQAKASINLVLSWASKEIQGVLTGKLFEYVSAGRPVLFLVSGGSDREAKILINKGEIGMYIDPESDLEELLHFVRSIYADFDAGIKSCRYNRIEVEGWTWKSQFRSAVLEDEHLERFIANHSSTAL